MRENIFTQVANAINAFAEHKINKEQSVLLKGFL